MGYPGAHMETEVEILSEIMEDKLKAKVFTANFNPKHVILPFIT